MHKCLMHKNKTIANFDCNDFYIKNIQIYDKTLMPFPVTSNPQQFNRDYTEWRKSRCIPCSTQNFVYSQPYAQGSAYSDISNSVQASINDCYWLKSEALSKLQWEDINYYKNKMSDKAKFVELSDDNFVKYENVNDKLQKYFLSNPKRPKNIKYFTLNQDNNYCLIKSDNVLNNGKDVYNEIIGNVLCDVLEIPHADYYIVPYNINYNNEILTIPLIGCELCIQDENLECITIDAAIRSGIVSKQEVYGDFIQRGFGDFVNKMITLDYLMLNSERDYTNFGYIRNSDTLEIVDVMPIYDCASSFNKENTMPNLDLCMPFRDRHNEQIKMVSDFSWLDINELYETIPEIEAILSYSPMSEQEQQDIINLLLPRIHDLECYITNNSFNTKNPYEISEFRILENIKRRFCIDKIKEYSGFDPTKDYRLDKIYFSFLTEEGKKDFNEFEVSNPNVRERFEHFKKNTFGIE